MNCVLKKLPAAFALIFEFWLIVSAFAGNTSALDAGLQKPFDGELKEGYPLNLFIETVMKDAGLNYTLNVENAEKLKVLGYFHKVPTKDILCAISSTTDVQINFEGETIRFTKKQPPKISLNDGKRPGEMTQFNKDLIQQFSLNMNQSYPMPPQIQPIDRKEQIYSELSRSILPTLDLKSAPVPYVIRDVVGNTKVSFFVAPSVFETNIKISGAFKNVQADKALDSLVGSSSTSMNTCGDLLTFNSVTGPAYVAWNLTGNFASVGSGYPSQESGDTTSMVYRLKFRDASEVLPILQGLGAAQVTVLNPEMVRVVATIGIINSITKAMPWIDDPESNPPPIRLSFNVKVESNGKTYNMSTDTVGTDGETLPIHMAVNFPVGGNRKGSFYLHGTAKPSVLKNGEKTHGSIKEISISLEGKGNVECSIPQAGSNLVITKDFTYKTSLKGTPKDLNDAGANMNVVVTSGEVDVDGQKAKFTIFVKATLEPGRVKGALMIPLGKGRVLGFNPLLFRHHRWNSERFNQEVTARLMESFRNAIDQIKEQSATVSPLLCEPDDLNYQMVIPSNILPEVQVYY